MFPSEDFPLHISLFVFRSCSSSRPPFHCGLVNFLAVPRLRPLCLYLTFFSVMTSHNSASVVSFYVLSVTPFFAVFHGTGRAASNDAVLQRLGLGIEAVLQRSCASFETVARTFTDLVPKHQLCQAEKS